MMYTLYFIVIFISDENFSWNRWLIYNSNNGKSTTQRNLNSSFCSFSKISSLICPSNFKIFILSFPVIKIIFSSSFISSGKWLEINYIKYSIHWLFLGLNFYILPILNHFYIFLFLESNLIPLWIQKWILPFQMEIEKNLNLISSFLFSKNVKSSKKLPNLVYLFHNLTLHHHRLKLEILNHHFQRSI